MCQIENIVFTGVRAQTQIMAHSWLNFSRLADDTVLNEGFIEDYSTPTKRSRIEQQKKLLQTFSIFKRELKLLALLHLCILVVLVLVLVVSQFSQIA